MEERARRRGGSRHYSLKTLLGLATALAFIAWVGCSGSSHAIERSAQARQSVTVPSGRSQAPIVAQTPASPLPPITFSSRSGDPATMYVELALTPDQQETGLMFRASMPDDHGMLFVFPQDTTEAFWMANTLIPLQIAFVDANATIVDLQEMLPLTLDFHYPAAPYRYSIEANATWYDRHAIHVGDSVNLAGALAHGATSSDTAPATASDTDQTGS